MKEFDNSRRQVFAQYIGLAQESAQEFGQPLGNVIKEDFVKYFVPDLKELDGPKIYKLKTRYGELTFNTKSRMVTSPFLEEGTPPVKLPKTLAIIFGVLVADPTQVNTTSKLSADIGESRGSELGPDAAEIKKYIQRLRRVLGMKLNQEKEFPLIQNDRGAGYALTLNPKDILGSQ